jgi:PHP N-terminal domain protein
MKAIDLHIHTIATKSDSDFVFSMESLEQYIEDMKLDIIAITNHNIFDINQFETIKSRIKAKVLPGIEINFEGGHLLLITDDNDLDDFDARCKEVTRKIIDPKDTITTNELTEIFYDLSKYLLIPHHPKKPKVPMDIITKMGKNVVSIEVSSIKDFLREYKENSKYVPLWFSDFRAALNKEAQKCGRTYLNIEGDDIQSIKFALMDREKVKLSVEDSNALFPISSDGFQISTGLNVIVGARSSGKSYLLDKISQHNENVKYIKQFSLLDKTELDCKKFNTQLSNRHSVEGEKYFSEFKDVINDVSNINFPDVEKNIDEYIRSLVKFAMEEERRDSFSKAKLYSEPMIQEKDVSSIEKLINSVESIIENNEHRDLIEKHIELNSLKRLISELAIIALSLQQENLIKLKANQIMKQIKKDLEIKSTSNRIVDADFRKYINCRDSVKKFNAICELVKRDRNFEIDKVGSFKLVMRTGGYNNVGEIKEVVKTKIALSDAFKKYSDGFSYLQELKNLDIPSTDYYKYYVGFGFDIINKFSLSASGGERTEYNLLSEIKEALDYDMLLIDEPESSFDNPFLKDELNSLIKDISKKMPVIVVTHNNTVGLSINPDYLLFTSRVIDDAKGEPIFSVYKGTPDSKYLLSVDEDSVLTKEVLMNSLEAGEPAYNNRREIYELHENR